MVEGDENGDEEDRKRERIVNLHLPGIVVGVGCEVC